MNKEMKTYQFNMTISVKEDISKDEILDKLVQFAEVNGYLIGGGLEEVEFEYKGFMSTEAQKFFEGNIIREQRDGCATVGSFIQLADGKTHLPSKGDKFIKQNGVIEVNLR
jgi:hypothetical protein